MVIDRITLWAAKRERNLRTWEAAAPGRERVTYWRAFALAFAICCFFTLIAYPLNGRSILWSADGLGVYYPHFIYEGEWIRGAIAGLLSGTGVPLWEWNLGYGADVLLTIDAILDPINLLSVLAPGAASEWMYQFAIVLRIFLSGCAFSLYALHRGQGRFATLCGALLYCLCITTIFICIWPGFGVATILFPLLLLGVENMLEGGRPYLFIGIGFLFFTASYYFSYMACILLVAYCAVRVFQTQGTVTVASFAGWVVKFAGCLALAIALAAWILVPEIQQLMSMDRVTSGSTEVPLFYSLLYYTDLFPGFLSHTGAGSDCYIGYGAIALFACLLMFSQKRRHTALKAAFIAMTAVLLVPAAGSIMNGFNYATNRWIWAYAFLLAFIVTVEVPTLLSLGKREMKFLLSGTLVYALAIVAVPSSRTEAAMAALFVCALTCSVLFFQGIGRHARRLGLAACLALSLAVNGFYFIDAGEGGWAYHALPVGTMYSKLTYDSPNSLVKQVQDDDYWRYDASPVSTNNLGTGFLRTYNDSLVQGVAGIDFYYSIYNGNIDRFHTEMAIAEDNINFMYRSLGARTILEEVCGVKYYLYPLDGVETTPYNYGADNTVVTGEASMAACAVVRSANPLPIGYTYGTVIPRSAYLAMTPAQRQQALLLGAVVDDDDVAGTGLAQAPTADQAGIAEQTVPYTVAGASGLTIEDGTIRVTSPNASLTLQLDGAAANAETYLYFDNLSFKGMAPSQSVAPDVYERFPWYRKAHLLVQDLNYRAPNDYSVNAQADKGAECRHIVNSIPSWHMYGGKSTWLLNLGYSQKAQSTVTISFPSTGEYSYSGLQIICQPMDNVNAAIDKLGAETMQGIRRGANTLSGSIDISQRKMLYLSVPYSKGWTAYVDGQKADIQKVNTAFMGIMLDEGHHDVELVYETPGLRTGALVSLGALVVLAGLALALRKRK